MKHVFDRLLVPTLLLLVLMGHVAQVCAQNVRALWGRNCAMCHEGNGSGSNAGSLLDEQWVGDGTPRSLYDTVMNGIPQSDMQAFSDELEPAQVWALVNYIYELRAQANPKPNTVVAADNTVRTDKLTYNVETIVEHGRGTALNVPWSVEEMPGGKLLIAERDGRLRIYDMKTDQMGKAIAGTPAVRAQGQGGLLDVALHPEYDDNGWVYVSFAQSRKTDGQDTDSQDTDSQDGAMTAIVRGKIDNGTFTRKETIYQAPASTYLGSRHHYGTRLVFEKIENAGESRPKYHLFFAIGDRGTGWHARDLTRPNGKVHRIYDDGSVPKGNPFRTYPGTLPTIWAVGSRNIQGMVLHPGTGEIWATEHGPRGGDELNVITRGSDYGWDDVSYGIHYSLQPFRTPWPEDVPSGNRAADVLDRDGITMPVHVWLPSIAACGLDVVWGDAFPAWQGDLLVGGLAGETVERLRVEEGAVIEQETIWQGQGRVRDVRTAPDGSIYIAMERPGKVVKLVPAE